MKNAFTSLCLAGMFGCGAGMAWWATQTNPTMPLHMCGIVGSMLVGSAVAALVWLLGTPDGARICKLTIGGDAGSNVRVLVVGSLGKRTWMDMPADMFPCQPMVGDTYQVQISLLMSAQAAGQIKGGPVTGSRPFTLEEMEDDE